MTYVLTHNTVPACWDGAFTEEAVYTQGAYILCSRSLSEIVTTGKSILQALDAIQEIGPEIVLAVTLVDRGNQATTRLADRGVPYRPLATYDDLGIVPVGDGRIDASATG